MSYLLIFIIGLLIGSFLNVCIYRIPLKQSIVSPPSHCTDCNTKLKPVDLIPVLSYLFYKGKCRYCKAKISVQYPIIELLTGVMYLLLFIKFNFSVDFIFFGILCSLLIIISGIDYEHQIIPNGIVLSILIIAIIYKLIMYFYLGLPVHWTGSIVGLLIGGGFLLLVAIIYSGFTSLAAKVPDDDTGLAATASNDDTGNESGGMGGGDIKLMGVLGFWLGWRLMIVTMLISFILGAVISTILLISKVKSRKDAIPFGPFIALAALITILKGNELFYWYSKNILIK